MRRFSPAIFRLITCVTIALATLELMARIDDFVTHGAPLFETYTIERIYEFDELGKKGKPGASYRKWRLNNLGYRGPDLRDGTIRILTLGASETFGLYETEDNEYPRQLERELNSRANRHTFDVVNAAFPAMPLKYMAIRAPEIARTIQPAMVVIYPSPANYIWLPWLTAPAKSKSDPPFELRLMEPLRTLIKGILPEEALHWARRRDIERNAAIYGKPMPVVPEANVIQFRKDLAVLCEVFRSKGIQPLLITHANRINGHAISEHRQLTAWRRFYPMLLESGFLDMEQRMNAEIRNLAATHGYTMVDAASSVPGGERYFADFVHFTDEGASLMAKLIADKIQDRLLNTSRASFIPVSDVPQR